MADTGRTVFADDLFADGFFAVGFFAADEPVAVPDVDDAGTSQASAIAAIEGVGLVAAVVTAYSSTIPAGEVISQDPAAGSSVAPGSTVTITVSLGEAPAQDGGIGGPDPEVYAWEYKLAKKLIAARLEKYNPPKDTPRLDPAERMLAAISKPAVAKRIPATPSRESIERIAKLVQSQSKVDPRIAVAVIEAYIQRQVDVERQRRDQEEEDFLLLVAQAMSFYH